jgi:hypothetical protein
MSYPITGQYNQQPATRSTTTSSSAETTLNIHAAEFISKLQPKLQLRADAPEFIPGHSQLNNFAVQVTQGEQHHNPSLNPVGYGTNYEGFQQTGVFFQSQQQNSWQTTAECEASDRHQQLLKDDVPRNPQALPQSLPSSNKSSRSPGFASKKPQKNSTTDRAVDNFIQKITKLYTSNNKDISKQVAACFNSLKTDVGFLTDDHRKQLLRIIPTISEMIATKNLDHISTVNILHSLAKIDIFCKLNPSNTPSFRCVEYEQESKNLIDIILKKILQRHEKYEEREWSSIFYSLGLLAEQSPYLITKEQINNLVDKFIFDTQKKSLNNLTTRHTSNILFAVVKLIKFNKLDDESIATYSFIEYLFQQIKCNIHIFTPQEIRSNIYSITNLTRLTEVTQLFNNSQHIIQLLLQEVVENKNLNLEDTDISHVINSLGMLINNSYIDKKLYNRIRETYFFLYSKIYFNASNINILNSNNIISGIIRLISGNVINDDKPSYNFIRDIFLNKLIANTSILNTKKLYQFMHTITFFQEYLTKTELIRILKDTTFFTPDVNNLNIYFTSMGYLLVKIRKELDNDKENKDLLNLEHKIADKTKKAWLLFHKNIENIDKYTRNAMYNTCSLIDEITNLDCLKPNYDDVNEYSKDSNFQDTCIDIIKTLIPNPENLQQEYVTNNLPPIDACITYPDGSLLAIEIQGPGHYIDNEGKHPTGKHLLKMAKLKQENIKVIEVNATVLMGYNDHREIAAYLINLLLENHVEIRPEYKDNIPQLLQDSGVTS